MELKRLLLMYGTKKSETDFLFKKKIELVFYVSQIYTYIHTNNMQLRNRKVYINDLKEVWLPIWKYHYGYEKTENASYVEYRCENWIKKTWSGYN